ncbi:MAG TPA: hypothetical protein VE220_04795, partial [Gaiellaceae bacterium]|nr:hypothetical protein [Gaiellaceae bacterium]
MPDALTPPCHRRTSVDTAIENAELTIAEFGLEPSIERLGGDPYPTYHSKLYRVGQVVSVSGGKGRGPQALASLLFEGI